MTAFQSARIPELYFGEGSFKKIEHIIRVSGADNAAVFTGSSSFRKTPYWKLLADAAAQNNTVLHDIRISKEPSPEDIDNAVSELKDKNIRLVIAAGGGSVVDAGKAVSAMLKHEGSVRDYLEGVGTKSLSCAKTLFAAVPTTAGTGSEATKNSVISSVGTAGFKKSLRHDMLVPDYAVVDPLLMLSCPPDVTAASGMDAVTQLLESFVSTKASILTDSLASAALACAGRSLEKAVKQGSSIEARADMAWASYVSGITLTNAGLGVVHGIASPAGGYSNVPHGVVCGTLIASAAEYITERLFDIDPEGAGIKKYARAYRCLTGNKGLSDADSCRALVELLKEWTEKLSMPYLDKYSFNDNLAWKTARASDGKNSPVNLETEDIYKIISSRIKGL